MGMCQIIELEEGVDLPDDKLALTCDINQHGFGLAWVEKGEFHTIRDITVNDPKRIGAELKKLNKFKRFLHVRHATVGEISMANTHPFVSLSQKGKTKIMMMHNGTLRQFEPGKEDKRSSDTAVFNRQFVMPLLERFAAVDKVKDILLHPLFYSIMKEKTDASVVILFDIYGNTCLFDNHNQSADFPKDGYWVSNTYSFNPQHHRSSAIDIGFIGAARERGLEWLSRRERSWNRGKTRPWEEEAMPEERIDELMAWANSPRATLNDNVCDLFPKEDQSKWIVQGPRLLSKMIFKSGITRSYPCSPDELKLQNQMRLVQARIESVGKEVMADSIISKSLKVERMSFADMAKIPNLATLGRLTIKDLTELTSEYPVAMAQAIIDLLRSNNTYLEVNATQSDTIVKLREKVVALEKACMENGCMPKDPAQKVA